MEIRKVTKITENKYPTEEIGKKEIKKSILNRWNKIGITVAVFNMLMVNSVFAFNTTDFSVTAGVVPYPQKWDPVIPEYITNILFGINIFMILVNCIAIIKNIIYKKKNIDTNKKKSLKKRLKIYGIISILVVIVDIICVLINEGIINI